MPTIEPPERRAAQPTLRQHHRPITRVPRTNLILCLCPPSNLHQRYTHAPTMAEHRHLATCHPYFIDVSCDTIHRVQSPTLSRRANCLLTRANASIQFPKNLPEGTTIRGMTRERKPIVPQPGLDIIEFDVPLGDGATTTTSPRVRHGQPRDGRCAVPRHRRGAGPCRRQCRVSARAGVSVSCWL